MASETSLLNNMHTFTRKMFPDGKIAPSTDVFKVEHHTSCSSKSLKEKKIISFKEQQPINEEQKKQNLDTISVGQQ